MSLCTLNVINVDAADVRAAMGSEDVLREINAPWLAVLPPEGEPDNGSDRLMRIARRLTKDNPAALALVFGYFDDDVFWVEFVREGRRVKSISAEQSWAFAGKLLSEMYISDAPVKAMRLMKSAMNLNERLKLLEQTVGTSLYDSQWEAPRRVEISDGMRAVLDTRTKELRRRKNRFALENVPVEEWPEYVRACAHLSGFEGVESNPTLFEAQQQTHRIADKPWFAVQMHHDCATHKQQLLVYDLRRDSLQRLTDMDKYANVIWITGEGEPVLEQFAEDGRGIGCVTCLNRDGDVKWTFRPDTAGKYFLDCLDVSEEGVISLFRHDLYTGTGAVYRIAAEDGRIICSRETDILQVQYVPTMDVFAGELPEREGILLLDGGLNEISLLPLGNMKRFLPGSMRIHGTEMWDRFCLNGGFTGLDLKTGEHFKVNPELPVCTADILPGGLFAAAGENLKDLMIFDREGRLLSRHKLDSFSIDRLGDGTPCVIELVWNRGGKYEPGTAVEDIRVWAIREVK